MTLSLIYTSSNSENRANFPFLTRSLIFLLSSVARHQPDILPHLSLSLPPASTLSLVDHSLHDTRLTLRSRTNDEPVKSSASPTDHVPIQALEQSQTATDEREPTTLSRSEHLANRSTARSGLARRPACAQPRRT